MKKYWIGTPSVDAAEQRSTSDQIAGSKPERRARDRGVEFGLASTTMHSGASVSVERMQAILPSRNTSGLVCAPPAATAVIRSTFSLPTSIANSGVSPLSSAETITQLL